MVLPVDNFLQKPDDSNDSYQVTHMTCQKNKCSERIETFTCSFYGFRKFTSAKDIRKLMLPGNFW